MKTKVILLFVSLFITLQNFAQTLEIPPECPKYVPMAEGLRADGKIYVVIAVISIVFICLIGYLIYIDMKVRKLERK